MPVKTEVKKKFISGFPPIQKKKKEAIYVPL